ncbi:MAG: N-acetylglucosaminyl-diphospho-decaprenol L-rhamnosyltransferase [Glaciecola sp.]
MTAPGVSRTAVVLVNHDTRAHLLACIETLQAAGADEVVVVDSGSSDGSVAAVRRAHPEITVLELGNVGFGRGANAGAARTDADVIVIANADTSFDPGAVRILADALDAAPTVGAVGPRVRYPDGRFQASARAFPSFVDAAGHGIFGLWRPDNRWTRRYRMSDADPAQPRDVDWLSGCALALRREAFAEVGGFDPAYFMYVEDVDLGWRLHQAGWGIRYVPEAGVVHEVGASTKARPASMVIAHARSLDRFNTRRNATLAGRMARPFVRLGLAGWVATVLVWSRAVRGRQDRSSTGE